MTFLEGPISSSSRAELAGLIVSLFSCIPVHAAIDSQVVLSTASKVLDYLSSFADLTPFRARLPQSVAELPNIPLKRQLPFLPNSDLWLLFWRTLVTRGTKGVIFKKTKGHALEPKNRGFLAEHPELRVEARHNDRADGIADRAREHFFHPNMRKLSTLLCKRHDEYVQFVRAIMNITTRVHKIAQELRSAHAAVGVNPERPLGDFITFVPPWEDEFMEFHPLKLKCTSCMLSHHLTLQPQIIMGFAKLLTHGLFALTTHTSGMTWLELMFISIAMTDHPMTLLQSSTAQAQVNLARQLREFAAAATTTLKFALADTDQLLFLGSQKPPNRLAAFGYHNRITHASVHIAMSRRLQSA